jgi:hypothetical protein
LIVAGSFISTADGALRPLSRLARVDRPLLAIGKLIPPKGQGLAVSISGAAGARVILEASGDLVNWTQVETNILIPTTLSVPGVEGRQFFRAVIP